MTNLVTIAVILNNLSFELYLPLSMIASRLRLAVESVNISESVPSKEKFHSLFLGFK